MASRIELTRIALGGLLLATMPVFSQSGPSLEEVTRRDENQNLVREGKSVTVQGVVAAPGISFGDYTHLSIRDDRNFGLIIEAPDFMIEGVTAGDQIEVHGVLTHRAGLPILRPAQLKTVGHVPPPLPSLWQISQVRSDRTLGLVGEVQGRVVALGEDEAGEYLLLDAGQRHPYPVYLPRAAQPVGTGLARFHVGDQVRIQGLIAQAAPGEGQPIETKYRMVVSSAAAVVLLERHWLVSPQILFVAAGVLGSMLLVVIRLRVRRVRLRKSVRGIHGLCEDLVTSASNDELVRKLRGVVPRALNVTAVDLYRYDRASETLQRVVMANEGPFEPVAVTQPSGPVASYLTLCFRNRTPLHVGDTRRSKLTRGAAVGLPRALTLLPMFAKDELVGVATISIQERPSHFGEAELLALHHFANQAALVLKMIDQSVRRDQLNRSEKLAVTGQLLSGVAGELRGPLESIFALSYRLLENSETEARAILTESLKATSILSRLSEVSGPQQAEAGPIEVNQIVHRIVDDLNNDWTDDDLELTVRLSGEALWTHGVTAQIKDVLGNLALLAARSAVASQEPRMLVETEGNSRRVLLSIRYGALVFDESFPAATSKPGQREVLGFSLCRGILHSMGGDVRILRAGENSCRMEIELPAAFPTQRLVDARKAQRERGAALTAVILEPELASQRRVVAYWSRRGHRAVPVSGEGEAFELLRRLKVDVIFCAVRTSTGSWVDFFDRVRDQVGAFVLLTDGVDSEAAKMFPQDEGFLLHKPIEAGELEKLLDRMEGRPHGRPRAEAGRAC